MHTFTETPSKDNHGSKTCELTIFHTKQSHFTKHILGHLYHCARHNAVQHSCSSHARWFICCPKTNHLAHKTTNDVSMNKRNIMRMKILSKRSDHNQVWVATPLWCFQLLNGGMGKVETVMFNRLTNLMLV